MCCVLTIRVVTAAGSAAAAVAVAQHRAQSRAAEQAIAVGGGALAGWREGACREREGWERARRAEREGGGCWLALCRAAMYASLDLVNDAFCWKQLQMTCRIYWLAHRLMNNQTMNRSGDDERESLSSCSRERLMLCTCRYYCLSERI